MVKFDHKILKLLLSFLLLWVLSLSFQQYQIGLLEKKANKVFPLLSQYQLLPSSSVLPQMARQLDTADTFASLRHWQKGLLHEWQGTEQSLAQAVIEINLAIQQRPGWPFLWRDLMRIGWKQGISTEQRTELLRSFRRVGDWNNQSVAELVKLYLPHWTDLVPEEQDWLSQQVPKVIGAYAWIEETKVLSALQLIPESLCTNIQADAEVLEHCSVDWAKELSQ